MKRIIISMFFLFVIAGNAISQQTIKGKVIDVLTGEPLVRVNIIVPNTALGASTNFKGEFILTSNKKIDSLTISLLSYKTKTIAVSSNEITIKLEPTIIELQDVVISATKTDDKVKDIPTVVYVINKSDILQTDARNIGEVLRNIPGTFTQDKYNAEYNVVSFRGVGLHSHVTRGILVLVDGIPVNEAMGRVDFEGIDMENVAKIEVLKGPVSALYGANGVSGVINIVTEKAPSKFESEIKIAAGSFNTKKINGNIGGRIGKLGIRINAGHYSSDGYRIRNKYETNKIGLSTDYDLENFGELRFQMNYMSSKKDVTGTLDSAQFEDRSTINTKEFAIGDINILRAGLSHKKNWSKSLNLSTNLYMHRKEDEGGYADNFTDENEINFFGGETKLYSSFNILKRKNSVIIGVTANKENGKSTSFDLDSIGNKADLTDKGNSIYGIIGYFIQNNYNVFDSLTLSLGIRYDEFHYDWRDNFPSDGNTTEKKTISAWSPKASLSYTGIKNLTLFANVGKGFNPPQISDLFIGGYNTIANPELVPEYLTNYEIGLRGRSLKRFNYQLSFFRMNFESQIMKDEVSGKYENIGNTYYKGIETAIDVKIYKYFMFSVNYAYLEAKFDDSTNYFITKTPKHQAGFELRFTHPKGFTGNINFSWIDSYYMDNEQVNIYDGYYVANAKFAYRWRRYSTSISLNNIFDENYATYASASFSRGNWNKSYYPAWPFNIMFSLGVKF